MADSIRKLRMGDGSYLPLPQRRPAPPRQPPPVTGGAEGSRAPERQETGMSAVRRSPASQGQVTIFGIGSVGSNSATSLAQMNYRLIVADGDRVSESNLEGGRSAFLPETLGMYKASALEHTLLRLGLKVEIATFRRMVQEFSDQEIRSLGAQSDAVLASFDESEQLLRLNGLLYEVCPVVYPGFHQGARTGHVITTIPGVTACLRCSMGIRSADQLRTLHAEPGFPPDIRRVADTVVRVISWLCAEQGSETDRLLDPARNIIFLDNRPSGTLDRSLSVHLLSADRNQDCAVCGRGFGNTERR